MESSIQLGLHLIQWNFPSFNSWKYSFYCTHKYLFLHDYNNKVKYSCSQTWYYQRGLLKVRWESSNTIEKYHIDRVCHGDPLYMYGPIRFTVTTELKTVVLSGRTDFWILWPWGRRCSGRTLITTSRTNSYGLFAFKFYRIPRFDVPCKLFLRTINFAS